ncbi:uncharacterized protein [Rutidosis leptorrhynchoides]|uniref:uncharacterized protein n=1 Tax=Rutidosis leptorrhynchoides TaxID=125765 RepID=UPI003A9946D5
MAYKCQFTSSAHLILVLTDHPIKQILKNPESSGRLAKWAIELGDYEINFSPRHAVKGQILADLLLETTEKIDYLPDDKNSNYVWELHTDGASSEEGVGAGLVLTSPEGEEHTYALKFYFYASNNEAEYEALLSGLHIATEMGIKHLRAYADVLSKLATLIFDHLHKKILVEVLKDNSIDEKVVVATVEEGGSCWMNPYMKYLQDGTLPTDVTEARRIKNCGRTDNATRILLANNLQRYSRGPFPRSVGNAKFLVVAIDFFSKWVEAKVLARITGENIKKFMWNNIICRYGLLNEIVSDNGKQFADNLFRSWCEELNIKQTFTSAAHPHANCQVEVTNKEILAGIKARLGLCQTKWVDGVPYILWAHRTTPKRSTGETPFNLVNGTEAVIPAEIRVPTQRILAFDTESNSSVLRENLNLLEERRIMTAIR